MWIALPLEMLIKWIAQYPKRGDTFSETVHNELYTNILVKKNYD